MGIVGIAKVFCSKNFLSKPSSWVAFCRQPIGLASPKLRGIGQVLDFSRTHRKSRLRLATLNSYTFASVASVSPENHHGGALEIPGFSLAADHTSKLVLVSAHRYY